MNFMLWIYEWVVKKNEIGLNYYNKCYVIWLYNILSNW